MANIIKINLNEKNDYVSKFNNNILSSELNQYILEECKGYSLGSEIVMEISCNYEMNSNEKGKIIDMIRSSFGTEISEMLVNRKRNIIIDIFVFIAGIFAIIANIIFSDFPIISEFTLVVSWVLIWEGVHDLIFHGFKNKVDIERKRQLTKCKIIFK